MTPLLPKEHGAYAQLAFPLLTGVALAPPTLSTLALGGAAVALFLANESAAVLLGARGMRLKDQEGPRARVQGGVLLVVGAIATLILPMAAVSGVGATRAALTAAVWWVSFGLGTLEVRAIKARHKKIEWARWTRWASPLASGSVLAGAVFLALGQGGLPVLAGPGAALIPPALAIFTLSLIRVHPKHLKRVGWSLVVANSLAFILLLQG